MPGTDLHSKAPDDLFSVDNLFSLGDEVNLIDSGMSTLNSLSSQYHTVPLLILIRILISMC